ncbi:MAG TPA: MFS transporter [Marinilabiliales bacterium]|nr:MAG: sodium:galactoside symporter [Bacteroidetes bacterium GWA2_40_14]OFX58829.1 MAG: sodium:galactoside symporter [Bacteroidetes bacterium GWC2_40_13]OFX73043.1 MAG: sodium:galactoside symporter [Bacteroidetes bacterium GWD2_40_43]OFX91521.1 MAG: sodium:galactoside symporter [Bacteroidetes bacterium GWE2_40_63]OFY19683.1 MAG: sodium:galactoside symporter [Bacteroidetes bacterium GWF2_40_13]OFZ25475.1 MAG: sodium:galactoside symporter [Bacteroidetes bacterium RIFOXYC2_FULL_40_12]HAN00390.1
MKQQNQKLSVFEKIGYGSGDAAVNVVISSFFLIITFFYTDVFGIKPKDIALLFLLVRFMDAIADPIMGLITDKFKTKHGRYRPYFLFLSVPFGISVFLTFTTPDFTYANKLIYAYSTYILVNLMFTMVTIPYISFISVLTSDPKEKLSANGYRLFFAKVAALLVSSVVPIMAKALGDDDIARGYQISMGIMALMGTLLFIFCFFSTTERIEHDIDRKPISEQFKLLFKNSQWLILWGSCLSGTVGYVIRTSVAIFYAKYFLGGDEKIQGSFLAVGVIASILAMPASTFITKRFDKIKLFWMSQLIVVVISVLMFALVRPENLMLAFPFYFILMFVVDIHAPVFWSAIAEAVDYGHAETGKRVSGLAFGGISFAQKAGMGIAGALVGLLLDAFGYVPDAIQSTSSLLGLTLMLTLIPAIFHLINGLLIMRYKITDTFYEGIKAKLNI